MNCAKVCPKGLNPAKAIAETKKLLLERAGLPGTGVTWITRASPSGMRRCAGGEEN
jgi:hypothetical protein